MGAELFHVDRRTYTTQLIVDFRSFAKALVNPLVSGHMFIRTFYFLCCEEKILEVRPSILVTLCLSTRNICSNFAVQSGVK